MYTEGITNDGAVILKDGLPVTITEVLNLLNSQTKYESSQLLTIQRVNKMLENVSKDTWIAMQGDDNGWKEWWSKRNKLNLN